MGYDYLFGGFVLPFYDRMKNLIVFLWVFVCVFQSFSQTQAVEKVYADSLLRLAETAASDSLKISRYLELSYFWSDRDTSMAFNYLHQARELMPSDSGFYQGLLHFHAAGIYFDRVIERGKKEYMEAEKYLKRDSSKVAFRFRARLWNNYGALLQRQDQEEEYIDILLHQAIPLAKKAGDSILVANNYQNVALILMNITDYSKADEYFSRAIKSLANYPKANEEKLTAFVNAAKNAIYSRNFQKARPYLDSARVQLNFIPHSLYAPIYYSTSGTFNRHNKNWETALTHLDSGLNLSRSYGDKGMVSLILFEKYLLNKELQEYPSAKANLLEAYEFSRNISHDRRLHLRELAFIDSKLGQFESAYNWLHQYAVLTDSVFEEDSEIKILELEKKYQSVEKENEILRLKDQNQQQQLSLKENKLLLVVLVSLLLITLLLVFFGWRLNKNKQKTLKQKELLHQQELKSIKQREQLTVYNAMLQGQEQERNRIARDLHDGLGGMLAGVKLKLSSIVSNEKKSNQLIQPDMEIYKVIQQLDQSVDELRRIARNMMPESLIYMGLEPALTDLCKSLNTEKTAVDFEAFNLGKTHEQALQITVYRIVQELLTNALKHAEANSIMVQCSENENRLYITVEDDGIGFNPETVGLKNGIGLSNIKNRVNLLQGTVEISSKPGEGTTFSIEIPLNEK